MVWISWLLALIAFGAVGYLVIRLRDERASNQRLRNERLHLADDMETLKANEARLMQAMSMSVAGQMAAVVAREVDAPIELAHSNLEGMGALLDEYRQLVTNYDAAVQYCLQPVEMIFGADKAGLDQLVKHVEEARRQLFSARRELEKSAILGDSKSLLTEAVSGLGRSSTLIQGLRQLTRLDADGLASTDINATLDAALSLIMPTWGERIVVVREFADLPPVTCMPAQICRAFVRIFENAGEAIAERGRISVTTRAGGTRNVEIRIADSGTGIADDVLPEVFEPYFSTRSNALGLGLSVAHGIIKSHGGSINVRTAADSGTSIIISLPITAAMTASASAAIAQR
ncbi:MAG TPA: ATP-binding protein [Dokdonella sp.]|uniref:sensor histidine kinase n=1 Tax=Dokdonella sp. TaxID=2291710 RepID=UPI002D7E1A6D|nr:ATP-binding protein [Dokdonella sp.]HET9032557.1 ATP-binding protein [Dokdonella sp.]